jgi:hypothetical protein
MPAKNAVGRIITDSSQVILEVDNAFVEAIKRDRRTLIGQKALSFTYGEDLARNKPLLDRLVTSGSSFAITKRYVAGDNSIIWVENHVTVIKTGLSENMLMATSRPIERPIAPDHLASNYQVVNQACRAIVAGKKIFSPDILSNPAAEILLRLYRAEIECSVVTVETIAEQVGSSVRLTQRWVALLRERELVDVENGSDVEPSAALRISQGAERAIDGLLASLRRSPG